jgi:SAM-dependent methyltransferase
VGFDPAWLIALPIVLGLGSILWFYAITGVPPVPSTSKDIADVITLLRGADLGEAPVIYELGAGLGDLALAIAEALPGAKVIGIERSPLPYLIARARSRNRPQVTIRLGDYRDLDLADADAVTAYLMIGAARRLAPLLDAKLRPGTVVVASAFWFRDRTPIASLRMAARYVWPGRP